LLFNNKVIVQSSISDVDAVLQAEVEEYLNRPVGRIAYRPTYRASSMERDRLVVPAPTPVRRSREALLAQTPVPFRSSSVDRMPALDPYRPQTTDFGLDEGITRSPAVAPYAPGRVSNPRPSGLPPKAPSFRPTMSDTRRRIREVMCSTKRDPHYYD